MKADPVNKRILSILLFFLMGQGTVQAQQYDFLSRGRMWLGASQATSPTYPGYFDGGRNALEGQQWWRMIYTLNGQNLFKKDYKHETMTGLGENRYTVIKPFTVTKNYNFSTSPNLPEEIGYSEYVWTRGALQELNGSIREKHTFHVWSLPTYDDFIIVRDVFVNEEATPITDMYFNILIFINITPGGAGRGFSYDTEYVWDPAIPTLTDEQGAFLFYDDTSIPVAQPDNPVTYSLPPGDVTGDRGDPGNIRERNSLDFQLYSPQVYANYVVNVTPNKEGKKKVYQQIFANPGSTVAPRDEYLHWQDHDYQTIRSYILRDQPRKSWRELNAQKLPGDGSVHERDPQYGYTVGPYDLAPGDSIEIIRLYVAGEIDRSISMLGGLEATQQYKEAGIAEVKKNAAAAMRLIEGWYASGRTNWNAGIQTVAAPTPADAPRTGNETNEIKVTKFSDPATLKQGFDIAWNPIPASYRDPKKGSNDVAGYRIYKSNMSPIGPWTLVKDLTVAEAGSLIQNGQIVYRSEEKIGVPTRYLVTAYDTDGLESGLTGYSYFAESAEPAPSNELTNVRVVPNPFRQLSGLLDRAEEKRLVFMNVPDQCTIRIYTVAGELVETIEHSGGGLVSWGTSQGNDYMTTSFHQNVAPGVYIFHVESHVPGHEGETETGKFVIIK